MLLTRTRLTDAWVGILLRFGGILPALRLLPECRAAPGKFRRLRMQASDWWVAHCLVMSATWLNGIKLLSTEASSSVQYPSRWRQQEQQEQQQQQQQQQRRSSSCAVATGFWVSGLPLWVEK